MKRRASMINLLPPEAKFGFGRFSNLQRGIILAIGLLYVLSLLSLGSAYAWTYHQHQQLQQEMAAWTRTMEPLVASMIHLQKQNETEKQREYLHNARKPYLDWLAQAEARHP